MPAASTAEQIASLKPDGIMLSNGPGDPADNQGIIEQLALLCRKRMPTFGICLGHQLPALSQGGRTHKLKYGHRGANQPVRDLGHRPGLYHQPKPRLCHCRRQRSCPRIGQSQPRSTPTT